MEPLPKFMHGGPDLKETQGEQLVSAISVEKLDRQHVDAQKLRGTHYPIMKDRPVFGEISPLEDILNTFKK